MSQIDGAKKSGESKNLKKDQVKGGWLPPNSANKTGISGSKHYFQAFFSSSIFSPYWSIVSPFWEEEEEEYRGVGIKISVKEAVSQFDGD